MEIFFDFNAIKPATEVTMNTAAQQKPGTLTRGDIWQEFGVADISISKTELQIIIATADIIWITLQWRNNFSSVSLR